MDVRVAQYVPVSANPQPKNVANVGQTNALQKALNTQQAAPATTVEDTTKVQEATRQIASDEGRGKLVDILV